LTFQHFGAIIKSQVEGNRTRAVEGKACFFGKVGEGSDRAKKICRDLKKSVDKSKNRWYNDFRKQKEKEIKK